MGESPFIGDKMTDKKLSIDESNQKILKEVAKLEAKKAELLSGMKSETEKPMASLAECNKIAFKQGVAAKEAQEKVVKAAVEAAKKAI